MKKQIINVFWFRRDLRLDDNHGFYNALKGDYPVLPIFIFDDKILDQLPNDDHRVTFIYESLHKINESFNLKDSSLLVKRGDVLNVWKEILTDYEVQNVFYNKDYEPEAILRDNQVEDLLKQHKILVHKFKDQLIFEEKEILKQDGTPYTVYTPYKNKWLSALDKIKAYDSENFLENLMKQITSFPTIKSLNLETSSIKIKSFDLNVVPNYDTTRDIPNFSTSNLGPYLRFGLVSVRKLVVWAQKKNQVFLSELIWREFFSQILFNFPEVVGSNFKKKYDNIPWINNIEEFEKWCNGETGYPIVDAGMRELNATGYMHNRVRMIVASFLCKHLMIDWRWGEAYFANKLFDFDLSSNNGNWQWVAGTGCDSAPYFRVFNPEAQQIKFDKKFEYIKKWNSNYNNVKPIVEHKHARERYLSAMKKSLQS